MSWTVIIPVKRLEVAKSRLRGMLTEPAHDQLVLAMAMDVATAALASPVAGRVVVVTADQLVAKESLAIGAEVIADVPEAGLNPALAYAAQQLRTPALAGYFPGVVALAADLPALRSTELTAALRATEALSSSGRRADFDRPGSGRAFVADAAGSGTVLLGALPGIRLEPCFGANSATAHTASGAMELTGQWSGLRRDVDTPADLAEAVALGTGPRTAGILAETALFAARDEDTRGPAPVAGG